MLLTDSHSCSLAVQAFQMFFGGWFSSLAFIINMALAGVLFQAIRKFKDRPKKPLTPVNVDIR